MGINTIAVTPGKLKEILKELYELRMSAFIWGEPGIGKSEVVKQFCMEEQMKLVDIRLTTMDAPDLRGLLWIDEKEGVTKSFRPEFFPKDNVKGCIFLDELTAAEPRMQATSYQLVLDKCIGPHVLPEKWMVLAAGNRPEDGAISYKMGSALADRFVHLVVEANPQDWLKWATSYNVHLSVLSFIRVKPDYLAAVQGQSKAVQMIAPSPRSWYRVSQVMKNVKSEAARSILINGIVGESAGIEFKHIVEEIAELPSMDVLFGRDKVETVVKKIPTKMACLYGLTYSMASYVKDGSQICRAIDIFEELCSVKTQNPIVEVQTLAMEMLLRKAMDQGKDVIDYVVESEPYKKYIPKAKQISGSK